MSNRGQWRDCEYCGKSVYAEKHGEYGHAPNCDRLKPLKDQEIALLTRQKLILEDELKRSKESYAEACLTIAKMHEAAVGSIRGPRRGVVEDVIDAISSSDAEKWKDAQRIAEICWLMAEKRAVAGHCCRGGIVAESIMDEINEVYALGRPMCLHGPGKPYAKS